MWLLTSGIILGNGVWLNTCSRDRMIICLCQVTIIILECCHSIYFYSILSCIIKTAFHFYLFYTPGSYSHILLNVQIAKTIHVTRIILNQTSRITDRTRTLNLKLCDRIRQSKGLCLERQNWQIQSKNKCHVALCACSQLFKYRSLDCFC